MEYRLCELCRSLLAACFFFAVTACKDDRAPDTLFSRVSPVESGIEFENRLSDSDDFNIIEYLYFYNGGGVALGDVNNDGLTDIYFSSNQRENKLYLNKGSFRFEDITEQAGAQGLGNWKTGISMADVNGDGFLDIFICGVGNYKKFNSTNQLLINNGDLTFSDRTDEYGLRFKGFSTQTSFFDYDNDGDLDMYLVNHSVHTRRSYGHGLTLRFQSDSLAGDKLYRNELIPSGKAHFTDVTKEAGILNSQIAYGLAVGVSDLNDDGWLDVYVSNDFNEHDYLYINNGDGTFSQQLERSVPHTSRFSMGNDIGDINNDKLPDIITLDMLPKDEAVIKTTAGEDPYEIYEFRLDHGYHYQFLRNTLQLNRGQEKTNSLMFSDIAPFAGIEASDWSWAPLLADFDNDGTKDLFVSNGILGRPNDLDYINFISSDSAQRHMTDQQLIEQMPSGKVSNVFFRNGGNARFENVTREWIGEEPSLSNGAAYGDLDNDGDLDLVINNINETASVYRNDLGTSNFIRLKFDGDRGNRFGVGTQVVVYANEVKLHYEQMPSRGWLSSVDPTMHIGLGDLRPDSMVIRWPGNRAQTIKNLSINQTFTIKESDALTAIDRKFLPRPALLQMKEDIPFRHVENGFNAFNVERLIPHMLSTQGPKIATADVNADGRMDFFIGGATGQAGEIFLHGPDGKFRSSVQPSIASDSLAEDVDASFADVNGDGAPDLIVVSGGQEYDRQHKIMQPRIYFNDGDGNFKKAAGSLPEINVNASCVRSFDIEGDGDVDIFIGGRVVPGKYGIDPMSYLLINDGTGVFTDESTRRLLPDRSLGMVSDAMWVDLNKDQRIDLIAVGEWMPITILLQDSSGNFTNKTAEYGLSKTAGWWNTIEASDFDGDGNIDFVVGNLGLNSRLRASIDEPVGITIGDIDNNNSLDHITTYYNGGRRYPFLSRDQLVKQIPAMRRQFLKYRNFKNVQLEDIVDRSMQQRFLHKEVQTFSSVYLKNYGNKRMELIDLPNEAQWFPIFSFCIQDLDNDGFSDIMAVGNFDAVQPEFGRYDAGYGLVMINDGKGNFKFMEGSESGFIVRGQGRDIKLISSKGGVSFLVSRNNDSVMQFSKTVGNPIARVVPE